MDITVTATDAFGNTGSVSSTGHTVNYVEPTVTGRHSILAMTFNQPVRPVESWAWHEKDGEGFKTEWSQAFPISGNGTWSIQYRDAFGQTHAEEITINEFTESGKDYSLCPLLLHHGHHRRGGHHDHQRGQTAPSRSTRSTAPLIRK